MVGSGRGGLFRLALNVKRRKPNKPLLARGDTVGVVATGFAVRQDLLDAGVSWLFRRGYRVKLGNAVLDQDGYLAGDDPSRAADLRMMLKDCEVRAIWFARGGYGTARILDRVPWAELRRSSKLLIGYSDLTALFAAAVSRTGQVCLYGPVVTELSDTASFHGPSLRCLLDGNTFELKLRRSQVVVPGKSRGLLQGGNLTVLTHLWGTRYRPNLDGCILFLEDVGEEAYRIDRTLTQLRLSGELKRIKGVILGKFDAPPRRRFPPDRNVDDVLAETFAPLGVPVVRGIPAGHVGGKRTLPVGGTAQIDTAAGRLRFSP